MYACIFLKSERVRKNAETQTAYDLLLYEGSYHCKSQIYPINWN
jgi:hypothetical protein